ncbi:hypothetical protein HS088_TW21G01452 [Tripterygium wilfordii]|uniref:Protein POLLENLESS 3 n=1 Tax=Tripterygium wilfordii TaxID=458696 RepID=A0A7J7C557_TRIWF|nr:uncharacterized protein LOC119988648 [Tripterygium wilfordii]KAF5729289.1 hypothetical protein HS088_TW21G01452 [Tripterygium wilfordii]
MSFQGRGFYTPPATLKSRTTVPPEKSMTEGKNVKKDLFHVVHKVPSGDSPYVRAKHAQLIEKDPSRAISMFWAAINAGDRVDSALKDMAVSMKQLDRSDEAIEAIKSFRHLCPYESQESIDNVLIELYKRSGRVEEEIEMLQGKLRLIEEGIAFGGKRTKVSRSQGRKIQITIEQERSRILGNLAWAYLQQHNYGLAEQHYRKALLQELDNNKECNLAICLMHMNRVKEAKSLLESVRASSRNKEMDESYAKSFERAVQMLNDKESQSMLELNPHEKEDGYGKKPRRSFMSPTDGNSCERLASSIWKENRSNTAGEMSSMQKGAYSSPALMRKDSEGLYTQPKRCLWGFNGGDQVSTRRGEVDGSVNRKLSFEPTINAGSVTSHKIQNFNGHLQGYTSEKSCVRVQESESELPSAANGDSRHCSWRLAHLKDDAATEPISQPKVKGDWKKTIWKNSDYVQVTHEKERIGYQNSSDIVFGSITTQNEHPGGGEQCSPKSSSAHHYISEDSKKKSWADMVEEDEERELCGTNSTECVNDWKYEEQFNDENRNINMIYGSSNRVENLSQRLEVFDLKDGYATSENFGSSRKPDARRSLRFEQNREPESTDYYSATPKAKKGLNFDGYHSMKESSCSFEKNPDLKRRNRLQVFRDITPTPDNELS